MTNEDEKLESMNNGDLAMEFLKKYQKCRENGVPNDMAILAVLHDLADWKDAHPSKGLWDGKKVLEWLKNNIDDYYTTCEFEEWFDAMFDDLRKEIEGKE